MTPRSMLATVTTLSVSASIVLCSGCSSQNTDVTAVPNATALAITTQPSAASASGVAFSQQPAIQLSDPMNNALLGNHFSNNGSFKNPSNGDYGQITLNTGKPSNCYRDNVAPNGSTPSDLQQSQPTCGVPTTGANTGGALLGQVLCDTGSGPCGADMTYPKATAVTMHPLPAGLPSMANPCSGVPDSAWCSGGKSI